MKTALRLTLAVLSLSVSTIPAIAQPSGGWSVAIEQNPMLTNCGTTTNIPVAAATDCTTAKAAAWNLLTTLLATPNCMNSGCPIGYTVGQGISTCTPDPYTRPNGSPAIRWQVSWTWVCVPPPCCTTYNLDISTGQGTGARDPQWQVNGNSAFITPPFSGWTTALTPAKWIQPVATPTPSPNVPSGVYHYMIKFKVPSCSAGHVQLNGTFAADNSASVLLDGIPVTITTCSNTCFKAPQAPVPLNIGTVLPGAHTLEIDVTNNGGASGLVVNAHLTRKCP